MDKLAIGIQPHAPCDEGLNGDLGLPGARRDVDDEAVRLPDNNALKRRADFFLVIVRKHVRALASAKDLFRERIEPREAGGVFVRCHRAPY